MLNEYLFPSNLKVNIQFLFMKTNYFLTHPNTTLLYHFRLIEDLRKIEK